MQVDESVSDDDLTWIKQMGVNYLNVQTGTGRATLENFVAIKKASRGRRVEGLEHIQQRQPEHRRDHSESTRTRPKNRVAQTVHSEYREGWYWIHYLRAHGQRHLVEPAGDHSGRRQIPGLPLVNRKGRMERQGLRGAAHSRAQVFKGRTLGQLHLLHQKGGSGGRGVRSACRRLRPCERRSGA